MQTFKITIKNNVSLIYPAQAAAKAYAGMLGFSDKEAVHIEILLEEILSNIIKYDFMPGQTEDINVCFDKTTLGISFSIHSMSIPLDVEKIKAFPEADAGNIRNHNTAGLGTLLINKLADKVTYTNKGRAGQYIYVEKYLPHEKVIGTGFQEKTAAELKVRTDFEFYVRRLKPEESSFISQLAYYTYNVSYIYDKIYYPECVRKLNAEGDMISVVAVNKENEDIIGHVAAVKHELSGLPELGVAFVNPEYRGGGCLNRCTEYLLDLLRENNVEGTIAHAVTTHPYSQKTLCKHGAKESALYVSRLTPFQMTAISGEILVRESLLLMYLPLKSVETKNIYVPTHHAEMIPRIYGNLGIKVNISTADKYQIPGNELTEIEVLSDDYGCSHIYIRNYGSDVKAVIESTLRSHCVNRVESIYLYLPIESQASAVYCAEFESLHFFFGGIVQTKNNMDFLMLQYLNNQVYPYESLQFCSEFGKELMTYIRSKDPNIAYK